MKHIHFIYGNQPFEIEEEINKLTAKLIPRENRKEAVFTFDVEDFFTKDQNQNQNLLSDFKNTCETVSFFSPVILVHLKNLQSLVVKKKGKNPLEKELQKIALIKIEESGDLKWADADTLVEPPETHFKLTGKQIVKSVKQSTGNSYTLILEDSWRNRQVYQQKNNEFKPVHISTFLNQKLDLDLEILTSEDPNLNEIGSSDDISGLICQYLTSPPEQVELIFSAHIKNTREIDNQVYALIKKNTVQIKKTIAYDDFRPVQWVKERAAAKHLVLDGVTADLMIEIAGSDFGNLDMELDKLSMLIANGERVTPETLLNSVSHSKNFTVFRISDSLLKKDLKNALESLNALLETHSADFISVFALIAAQFRKALKISWMTQQGLPEKIIIENLAMNQWIAKQLIKQVENFTTKELENLIIHLSKCDVQLKYSSKGALTLLENICFLICQNEFRKTKTIKSKWLP